MNVYLFICVKRSGFFFSAFSLRAHLYQSLPLPSHFILQSLNTFPEKHSSLYTAIHFLPVIRIHLTIKPFSVLCQLCNKHAVCAAGYKELYQQYIFSVLDAVSTLPCHFVLFHPSSYPPIFRFSGGQVAGAAALRRTPRPPSFPSHLLQFIRGNTGAFPGQPRVSVLGLPLSPSRTAELLTVSLREKPSSFRRKPISAIVSVTSVLVSVEHLKF